MLLMLKGKNLLITNTFKQTMFQFLMSVMNILDKILLIMQVRR